MKYLLFALLLLPFGLKAQYKTVPVEDGQIVFRDVREVKGLNKQQIATLAHDWAVNRAMVVKTDNTDFPNGRFTFSGKGSKLYFTINFTANDNSYKYTITGFGYDFIFPNTPTTVEPIPVRADNTVKPGWAKIILASWAHSADSIYEYIEKHKGEVN